MNRLVATVLNHRWWTMQNAMMNLLLVISNGLGLKSVSYCFQVLEFHTYNNNSKIVFITVLYIPHIVLYIPHSALFPPCNFMENIALFFSLILPRKILYLKLMYIKIHNVFNKNKSPYFFFILLFMFLLFIVNQRYASP